MEGTDDIPIQPKPTGEQYTPHEQTVSTLCKRDPKPAPDITQPDVLDTFIDHLVEEARLEVIYPNAIAVIDLLFLHIFASIRISEVLQPGLLPILFRETRRPLEDIWQRVADGLISSLFDEEPTYSEPPAYMTLAFYGNPTGETFDVKTFTVPAADGTVDTPTPISMEAVVGAEAPSNADDEEEEYVHSDTWKKEANLTFLQMATVCHGGNQSCSAGVLRIQSKFGLPKNQCETKLLEPN